MPITSFVRIDEFDPEALTDMAYAFAKLCASLGLSERADAMTEIVARRVIEFARRGMRNDALYFSVLREFHEKPTDAAAAGFTPDAVTSDTRTGST